MGLAEHTNHPDPEAGITRAQYERIQAKVKAERSARLRLQDMAYRLALGLPLDEPLPKELGETGGAAKGKKGLHFTGTKRLA